MENLDYEFLLEDLLKHEAYWRVNIRLAKIVGIEAALYLAALTGKYSDLKNKGTLREDGYFYFTTTDILKNTTLTLYKQLIVRKILQELNILEYEKIGMPARYYYKINYKILFKILYEKGYCLSAANIATQVWLSKDIKDRKENEKKKEKENGIKEKDKRKEKEKKENTEKEIMMCARDNLKYLPEARLLSRIVQKKKNIFHSKKIIEGWENSIRLLVETNKIDRSRLRKVLKWYSKNIGGEFVPVVESGQSLRNKFIRLEDAMLRQTPIETKNLSPKQIFDNNISKKYIAEGLLKSYQEILPKLVPANDQSKAELASNMVSLYKWFDKYQDKEAVARYEDNLSPGPFSLVTQYVDYLNHESWIKDISPKIFMSDNNIVHKYLKKQSDFYTFDIMTGVR